MKADRNGLSVIGNPAICAYTICGMYIYIYNLYVYFKEWVKSKINVSRRIIIGVKITLFRRDLRFSPCVFMRTATEVCKEIFPLKTSRTNHLTTQHLIPKDSNSHIFLSFNFRNTIRFSGNSSKQATSTNASILLQFAFFTKLITFLVLSYYT
jgi:hypothetical protein